MAYSAAILSVIFCLACIFCPKYRIHMLAISSVFQAAVPFSFDQVRVWFYHPVAICCIILGFFDFLRLESHARRLLLRQFYPFLLFGSVVLVGAILFPILFAGTPVFLARGGMDFSDVSQLMPLGLSISNFAQVIYFFLNIFVIFFILLQIVTRNALDSFFSIFASVLIVGACFFFWQWISIRTGFYFPEELVRGEYDLAPYTTDNLIFLNRMNGSFGEPADLGLFAGVCFAFGLSSFFILNRLFWGGVFLVISLVMIVYSGSTTAYVAALGGALGLLLMIPRIKMAMPKLVFMVILGIIGIGILSNNDFVSDMFESSVRLKSEAGSFDNRLYSVYYSFSLFVETFGFGVGLGSNRPSSMLALLVSCLGVGAAPLFMYLLRILYKFIRSGGVIEKVIFVCYMAILFSIITAIPDLSHVIFGFFTSLMIAVYLSSRWIQGPVGLRGGYSLLGMNLQGGRELK